MTAVKNTMNNIRTNRRAFFLRGGAALGAGLAATSAAASNVMFDGSLSLKDQVVRLQAQLQGLEDREAIRQLLVAYTTLLENRAFDALPQLFTRDAGRRLEKDGFRDESARRYFAGAAMTERPEVMQTAFRLDGARRQDDVSIAPDRRHASAVFHCQVELSISHTEDSTLADMARLQGQYASSRWLDGQFVLDYRREDGHWKISRLEFRA